MGKFIGKLDREQRRLAISCAIGLVVGVATYFATDTIKSGKDYIEWNGGIYRGDISNGIPNGNGKLEKDGMTYTGFWENGEMASGHIESDKYVYEGELKIATDPILSKYDLWIADIGKERPNASNCIIWQFSHNGEINGITQNNVDLNLFYGNHASLVKYVKDKGIK